MKTSRKLLVLSASAACAAAMAVAPGAARLRASDAGDSAQVRVEGQLDLNDLYVFTSAEDPARTIFIVTASPFAGTVGSATFATKATYNLLVDLTGDAVEDDVHSFTFAEPGADGKQAVTVSHRGRGPKFKSKGTTGTTLTLNNGTRVLCGVFDDPAFFDLLGARRGNVYSPTTSRNFFGGVNTLALVVDVANGEFGAHQGYRVWATTAKGRTPVDRVGRPMVTSLIPAVKRDLYNRGRPKDDAKDFQQDIVQRLVSLRGGNYTGVNDLAGSLVPDVLLYQPGDTLGFADGNGRRLADDVVDFQLDLFTDGAVTTDHVANDSTFGTTFPYLAPANP
jgi:hypothetical protein